MRYALLVYSDQTGWADLDEEEAARLRAESMPRWLALFEELGKADPASEGKELAEASESKVVRVRGGERIVTDGPFADTKEVIGGVFLTELPDLDEAIRLASLVPAAEYGSIEVRPLVGARRGELNELERAYREEWGRALAILIRVLGDFDLAEDAVQDAFTIAAERWPRDGVPRNPGAWIVTTARNRAIDRIRRDRTFRRKAELLGATRRASRPMRRT